MKDASKRAEPGIKGVVIRHSYLRSKQSEQKRRARKILLYQKNLWTRRALLKKSRDEKLTGLLKDQISNGIRDVSSGKTLIKKSTKLTLKRLNSFDMERFAQDESWVEDKSMEKNHCNLEVI